MNKMTTPWAGLVDKKCPLPEYPRPQLVRDDWQNLNGEYQYCILDKSVKFPESYDGEIIVPFSVETPLSGVEKPLLPSQKLWYRRLFTLDDSFDGKRCILHFGAVDWKCGIYVNRQFVGRHVGGYCPFSFDITDCLVDGENELVVGVYDPTDAGWQQRGKQVLNTHGFWYTATSGIWQTVWLEPVNETHISKIRLLPDIDAQTIKLDVFCDTYEDITLRAEITAGESIVFGGEVENGAEISVAPAQLWSPESPFLYDIKIELFRDGDIIDTVKSYFGMRKFCVGTDERGIARLFLNNKPYFQRGLLDQGYFCEGGLTPPTDEAMIYDIRTMKDLGFNLLRKHIKVEPARWYYHCDKIGMLVWQDMVSGGAWIGNVLAGVCPNLNINVKDNNYKAFSREKPEWRENYKTELFEMLDALYNTVSIYCWVPFNEGWGQFDAKEIAQSIKAFDPSRVVDHASGWHDQKGPELKSVHRYILPISNVKPDGRPFVLSEYGGYSMIDERHVFNKSRSFGYIMYKTRGNLTAAYKNLHEKQVIPKIEKGLSATVYTQVTDVEFEVNGILTYDRLVMKIDADVIREINEKMRY